jgi:4-amino-4-deoxy-L-arabinose transferase-like glycosyltransferase
MNHRINLKSSDIQETRSYSRKELVCLLLILVASFLLRMAFLNEPFERDEGFYAYIGQEILRGKILYRDMIDIKPPGIYYLNALIIGLFGPSATAIRIFTAFYGTVTIFAVHRLARYLAGPLAGLCAALLFGVFSSSPRIQGSSSNTEVFMLLPLVAATYYFLRGADTGKKIYYATSGLLSGIAMLIKTVALPQFMVLFLWIFFVPEVKGKPLKILANCVSFLVPPLLIALMTCGFFLYHGAFDDFIYWNVTFILGYAKTLISGLPLFGVLRVLAPVLLLLTLLALSTCIWIVLKRRNFRCLLIVALLVASIAGVWLPQKYFNHYFIQLLPVLALLAGIGSAKLLASKGWKRYAIICVLILGFSYWIKSDYKFYMVFSPEMMSVYKYGTATIEIAQAAEYVKNRTSSSDIIYQWGFDPGIYFLTERQSPNKYCSNIFVEYSKNPKQAIVEVVESINLRKPKYIIVDAYWAGACPSGHHEIVNIINRDYSWESTFGNQMVYRRSS